MARALTEHNILLAIISWEEQQPGTVAMPDFVRWSAKGMAKIVNGKIYLHKDRD